MTNRLNENVLKTLNSNVSRPHFDRHAEEVGVVHLGVGAFHRAHQAVYFQHLMEKGERHWMIKGASLRSPTVAEQLNPQNGLYTVLVRDSETEEAQICASIRDVLVAPEDPSALVAALADPEVALVTLTVTEKGYCVDVASGKLKLADPDVQHDIKNIGTPRTAPGFIVSALKDRKTAGLPPFTVLSCDNLSHNGQRIRAAVIDMAREIDQDLASWIESHAAFPSSMVDRIVPATTPEDIDGLEERFGYRDEAMVKAEPFSQWVVEDWFSDRRPPLEKVGVQMTDDVAGWESAKLRMLNAAHSLLCYLGALAGHEYIYQTMAAPGFERVVDALWDEVEPILPFIDGFDAPNYRRDLKQRFSNSALKHSTVQIAMDGSQKLPQRLLTPMLEREKMGLTSPAMALAVAGWMRWQVSEDEQGNAYRVDDPLADKTSAALRGVQGDAARMVEELTKIDAIFDGQFAKSGDLQRQIADQLLSILEKGAATAVRDFGG